MVFHELSRNCDDLKENCSFILRKGSKYELSPVYDVCHSYQPGSKWMSQHALSINGKRKNITLSDFLAVAKRINIKKPKDMINHVNNCVSKWPEFASKVKVDERKLASIKEVLLFIEAS